MSGDLALDHTADRLVPLINPLHTLDQYLDQKKAQDPRETTRHTHDEILRAVDFLYGSTLDGALSVLDHTSDGSKKCSTNVTHIKSKHRSVFTVKGQSAGSSYMCILPRHDKKMYYCSCRSFLDRGRSFNICKHLLAIRLMPALDMTCPTIELQSEEEFSRAVLQRLRLSE